MVEYCQTLQFEMVQELDPSGTDALWYKYSVRVRGFVSGPNVGGLPGAFRQDTSTVLAAIKDQLETPRRALLYTIGTTELVRAGSGPPLGTGRALDSKLGPFPMPAVVTHVSGDTFMVECGVVVRLTKCDEIPTGCRTNPVVSLRWSQTEVFDQNWYANLVTQGKLIVRSDLGLTADTFRPLATPPLLPDYIRKRAQYVLSPTGTELDFYFEDQEVDRLPPFAATTAAGTFHIHLEKGQKRTATCVVDLEGPKTADRKQLLIKAISMCQSKLNMEVIIGIDGSPPLVWGDFREDLFKVAVHVSMSAYVAPIRVAGGGGIGAVIAGMGGGGGGAVAVLGPAAMPSVGELPAGLGTPLPGIAPPTRKRLSALLAAAFRDPCCGYAPGHPTGGSTGLASPPSPAGAPRLMASIPPLPNVEAEIAVGATLPPPTTETITDSAPYDTYIVETSVACDHGRVHLPGTGVGPTAGVGVALLGTGGLMKMTVAWVASRIGKPPVLPAYFTDNANAVPLGGALTGKELITSADGNSVRHMTAGWYAYAILNPSLMQIANPVPPFYTTLIKEAANRSNAYFKNIYQFQGAAGTNPFVPGGSQNGENPSSPPGLDGIIGPTSRDPEYPDWGAGTGGGGSGSLGGP